MNEIGLIMALLDSFCKIVTAVAVVVIAFKVGK